MSSVLLLRVGVAGAAAAASVAVCAVAAALAPARRAPAPRRHHRLAAIPLRGTVILGRPVRAMAGRPLDPTADARAGRALVAVAAGVVLGWPVGLAAGAAALAVPPLRARRRVAREQARLAAELPEAIDLLSLVVGGGLNVRLAVEAVEPRAPPRVSRALASALAAVRAGERLPDALDGLPSRYGEPLRPLVSVLAAADRYGAPLGASLDRLATEARAARRRHAETAARRVPVKLLFPLVLCVLPAFALLTVVPVLLGTLRSLRL